MASSCLISASPVAWNAARRTWSLRRVSCAQPRHRTHPSADFHQTTHLRATTGISPHPARGRAAGGVPVPCWPVGPTVSYHHCPQHSRPEQLFVSSSTSAPSRPAGPDARPELARYLGTRAAGVILIAANTNAARRQRCRSTGGAALCADAAVLAVLWSPAEHGDHHGHVVGGSRVQRQLEQLAGGRGGARGAVLHRHVRVLQRQGTAGTAATVKPAD